MHFLKNLIIIGEKMYIDYKKDVDRTKIPIYLKETMDTLDDLYIKNKDGEFGMILPQIVTFTDSAEANHRINDKTRQIIRNRYGIMY